MEYEIDDSVEGWIIPEPAPENNGDALVVNLQTGEFTFVSNREELPALLASVPEELRTTVAITTTEAPPSTGPCEADQTLHGAWCVE